LREVLKGETQGGVGPRRNKPAEVGKKKCGKGWVTGGLTTVNHNTGKKGPECQKLQSDRKAPFWTVGEDSRVYKEGQENMIYSSGGKRKMPRCQMSIKLEQGLKKRWEFIGGIREGSDRSKEGECGAK